MVIVIGTLPPAGPDVPYTPRVIVAIDRLRKSKAHILADGKVRLTLLDHCESIPDYAISTWNCDDLEHAKRVCIATGWPAVSL